MFSGFSGGFFMGFASGFFSREIVKVGSKVSKPLVDKLTKFGEETVSQSKERLSHVYESFEDIVAEVKSNVAKMAPESAVVGVNGAPAKKATKSEAPQAKPRKKATRKAASKAEGGA